MAKALNTAAKVIGAVATVVAVVTGSPVASAIALNAAIVQKLTAKKPQGPGTQTSFKADPNAGIPYVIGRTLVGGNIVYWEPHGSKNKYQSLVIVMSGAGPIESIDQTYLDKEEINFSGGLTGSAVGSLSTLLNQDVQLGASPETAQLSTGIGTPPSWDAASLLSGLAASMLTMKFDAKGDVTLTSTPRMGWLLHGVKVYDPRLDDTYPGGSGPQRSDDESTWAWSDNPFLHGLAWALGRYQNGVRVMGVGMPVDQIDVANFVEGANVCDANGWKAGGQVDSAMDKWNVLKLILQAGGGEPIRYGARLSCIVNAPKVILDTIDHKQVIGEASIPSMQGRRNRINGIVPGYRSEDHGWETVSAGLVRNSTYLTEDGTERTEEVDFALVQCEASETPDQAAQLAGYRIANSREAQPIVMPLKPRWIGYRIGDCIACDADEANLSGRQLVVMGRSLDVSNGSVTLTLRTEDPDKHDWALGLTGVAAPLNEPVTGPDSTSPDGGDWSLSGISLNGDGLSLPALVFAGAVTNESAIGVRFEYYQGESAPVDPDDWISTEMAAPTVTRREITSLIAGSPYMGAVSYAIRAPRGGDLFTSRLILGPVTVGVGSAGLSAGFLNFSADFNSALLAVI
jgi:hypothetical protein